MEVLTVRKFIQANPFLFGTWTATTYCFGVHLQIEGMREEKKLFEPSHLTCVINAKRKVSKYVEGARLDLMPRNLMILLVRAREKHIMIGDKL